MLVFALSCTPVLSAIRNSVTSKGWNNVEWTVIFRKLRILNMTKEVMIFENLANVSVDFDTKNFR